MFIRRVVWATVTAALLGGSALAKGASYRQEDRYNPQHIQSLPHEIRTAIVRLCPDPRALHEFTAYSNHYGRIVLHFEHFYCQGHDVFCKASDCLHQVYVSSRGHYRLERSYYGSH